MRRILGSYDVVTLCADAVLVFGAYLGVLLLRFDGDVPGAWITPFFAFVAVVIPFHLASNLGWGLYQQMWRHASAGDARRVLMAGATAAVTVMAAYLVLDHPVPLSVAVLGCFVATFLVALLRFRHRLFPRRPVESGANARPGLAVVIVGAGEAGAAIVREMHRSPTSGLMPVAILDDDPHKLGRSLLGVPVVGGTDELVATAHRTGAHRVILAIGDAPQTLVKRVALLAEEAEVPLQVLPSFGELMRDSISLRDVRDLQIEDLIGREEVKIDLDAIRGLLFGRRVLITGGGGSIGSEIARQVAKCELSLLVLVDHDETHLYDVDASLPEPATCVLADVRDEARVRSVFETHRPEIVFHAAANKHVPILQDQACEALATNVLGTLNLVTAAEAVGTERFVFISTDKAVDPVNVMGATKWVGEQVVLARPPSATRFCAVRFGNVLGSRGSVVPTFARQIQAGGPVTVTDKRMTRFFMTIEEAVKLVLQAATFASGSEVFLLEMGEPVNIYELAKRMIRLSGYQVGTDIAIEITGIRGGEKLTEELASIDESSSPTEHHAIIALDTPLAPSGVLSSALDDFADLAASKDDAAGARRLFDLVATVTGRPTRAPIDIDLVTLEQHERSSSSAI